jgi:hypothetical protein
MKITTELLVRLAFAVCLFASVSKSVRAQDSAPYTEGSVWQVSFIKIKTGQDDDYLKSLKTSWQALVDEGKKEGYILSSKILYGEAANPSDFATADRVHCCHGGAVGPYVCQRTGIPIKHAVQRRVEFC